MEETPFTRTWARVLDLADQIFDQADPESEYDRGRIEVLVNILTIFKEESTLPDWMKDLLEKWAEGISSYLT